MPGPARKGTGWMVFAIVLLVLLGLSVLLNIGHSLTSGLKGGGKSARSSSGPRMEEVVMRDNDAENKIAVIDVEGVIAGGASEQGSIGMVSSIKEQLRRAKADDLVKAVILRVNSPGGEVLASDEIANAITKFRTESKKPVVVSMGSLAASGGYYVSAPCDWIVANELTITGSIGVIMHGFNYRSLLDKVGVRPEVYKSGKFKDMLSGTKSPEEVLPEERKMVQALIDETFNKFKDVVRSGRNAAYKAHQGRKLSSDWEDYADGRILSGKEAEKLGFVDQVGDLEVAVTKAEELGHVSKDQANLIQYQPLFDLSNLFRLFGESNAKSATIKLDIGIDAPNIKAGYLYFLSSTYIH
ncbi:signal peptide peptidase SppA, 36K type [Pedosphaera parvula Ellin514]|uniref:Signal peptide peptidase SppA, 36K type n=2 Tax=Pedosphaera TaxID=1032526 RepID=B9XGK5_PEDPL|nr:signal peptide peptidase SppA, 36K type [Pedosphaera parvula Ellin514]